MELLSESRQTTRTACASSGRPSSMPSHQLTFANPAPCVPFELGCPPALRGTTQPPHLHKQRCTLTPQQSTVLKSKVLLQDVLQHHSGRWNEYCGMFC